MLRWTPEAEIEIVEAQLKGDTVLLAAAFQMKEEAENGGSIASVAKSLNSHFYVVCQKLLLMLLLYYKRLL